MSASGVHVVAWHVTDHAEGAVFRDLADAQARYGELEGGSWAARLYDPELKVLREYGGMSESDWAMLEAWAKDAMKKEAEMELLRKYAVAMGKVIAGVIRCLMEDVLSGLCQLIYLAKMWRKSDLGSKAFTLMSVAAGIAISLTGPLYEFLGTRKLKQAAMESGYSQLQLGTGDDEAKEAPKASKQQEPWAAKEGAEPSAEPALAGDSVEAKASVQKTSNLTVVPNIRITDIVRGRHCGQTPGRLLLGGAVAFWLIMLALPFLVPIECGKGPTAKGHLIFFGTSMCLSLVEVWITIKTRQGYLMFSHLRPKYVAGYVFSLLGRFDTYSDVTFARMISKCEPITWFSIWEHYFYLPFGMDLATCVLVILGVGVFLCQALPGVILLAQESTSFLPIAFKLNEYNLLLAVMEAEVNDAEANTAEEDAATAAALEAGARALLAANPQLAGGLSEGSDGASIYSGVFPALGYGYSGDVCEDYYDSFASSLDDPDAPLVTARPPAAAAAADLGPRPVLLGSRARQKLASWFSRSPAAQGPEHKENASAPTAALLAEV